MTGASAWTQRVGRATESRPGRTTCVGAAAGALAALVCTPGVAHAHGFAVELGPAAGLLHPLTGLDHLLAMVMVGVLSAQLGGRAVWVVPAGFVAAVLVGGLLGVAGLHVPGTEMGIAASVVALGAAGALGLRVPVAVATTLAGVFGLYHGFAHGAEMPHVRAPGLYVAGFIVTTAGLHLMGALGGLLTLCRPGGLARLRVIGVIVAASGLALLARGIGMPGR